MVLDNRFKMLFVPHLKIQKRFEIESESNVVMRWAEGKKTHLITGLTPRYFFTLITPPFTFSKINFKGFMISTISMLVMEVGDIMVMPILYVQPYCRYNTVFTKIEFWSPTNKLHQLKLHLQVTDIAMSPTLL